MRAKHKYICTHIEYGAIVSTFTRSQVKKGLFFKFIRVIFQFHLQCFGAVCKLNIHGWEVSFMKSSPPPPPEKLLWAYLIIRLLKNIIKHVKLCQIVDKCRKFPRIFPGASILHLR